MKMFIPELGTRIVLLEDFTFDDKYSDEDITLEKGVKISVKRIQIKKGRSYDNHIEFTVLKCKENKFSKHCGEVYQIKLYELTDMEFELETCNDDTKEALIKTLDDIQNHTNGVNYEYRKVESVLLDSKNLLAFSPQQPPMTFFKKAIERMKKREKEFKDVMSYDKLYAIVNKHFRKNKIAELLKEDS
jgi:hypothetical protein